MTGFHSDHVELRIVSVREHPELTERAINYFASKWGIARIIYQDCVQHSLTTQSPLPRWYLLLRGQEIIGSYGLLTNDYVSRQDLWPWLACLYIEEAERGQQLGGRLLNHGRDEAARLGFPALYLHTDHVGFYEKFGWTFLATAYGLLGEETRVYWTTTPAGS